jgi:ATP-dependent protease ClpP protease subunit
MSPSSLCRLLKIFCFLISGMLTSLIAHAELTIWQDSTRTKRFNLERNITLADAHKFQKELIGLQNSQAEKNDSIFISISLNSEGGDVNAALKIGELLRSVEGEAWVVNKGICYSSCILVLAGGVRRDVSGGTVGIHRPYIPQTVITNYREMGIFYKQLTRRLEKYFDSTNIDRKLASDMMKIPPEQIVILSRRQLDEYGLSADDINIQETDAMAKAAKLGISRQELAKRRAKANSVCGANLCEMPKGKINTKACFDYTFCREKITDGAR